MTKKIINDIEIDVKNIDPSIAKLCIFHMPSLIASDKKELYKLVKVNKSMDEFLKIFSNYDSVAKRTYDFLVYQTDTDNFGHFIGNMFEVPENFKVIDDTINTLLFKDSVSESEIYASVRAITKIILKEESMKFFYYIMIGKFIVEKFLSSPVYVDKFVVKIEDVRFVINARIQTDYTSIPMDKRIYDANMEVDLTKKREDVNKAIQEANECYPEQCQIVPPITRYWYIPVPMRSVESFDKNGVMSYYAVPEKYRAETKNATVIFRQFPLITDDSEDEMLDKEPDTDSVASDKEDDVSEAGDDDPDQEVGAPNPEADNQSDDESVDVDEEDDPAPAPATDNLTAEHFWQFIANIGWVDKSQSVMTKDNINDFRVLEANIQPYIGKLAAKFNNEMDDVFYRHVILKGKEFYDNIMSNPEAAYYLLDGEINDST
jgi:hypothetical protein